MKKSKKLARKLKKLGVTQEVFDSYVKALYYNMAKVVEAEWKAIDEEEPPVWGRRL